MSGRPIDAVLDALRDKGCDPRHSHGQWSAKCPSHDDQRASLSVGEGSDGRPLLTCHANAGCEYEAILAALDLPKSAGRPDGRPESRANGSRRAGDDRQIVATYDYVDEAGELLFQTVRYSPKDFRQRRPNGKGGWEWNLRGVRRVLYRLPEVLQAKADGQEIYVVEGEKDVDALRKVGQIATCNPMGAGKWAKEHTDALAGAHIVLVVADRDPAGYDHARAIAKALKPVVDNLTIWEPVHGKDTSEHLLHVVNPPHELWRTFEPIEFDDDHQAVSDDGLPVAIDWHELFNPANAMEEDWLVEDVWPAARAIAVVAQRKAGKSLLFFYLACCLAKGVDPWTLQPREPVHVGYFDYEMTEEDVRERAEDFGMSEADLSRLHYYLLPSLPPLDTLKGGERVVATLKRDGATVAIFDTFGRAVDGPEDEADTVRAFYAYTATLLKRAGIASARLDHTGHENLTRARGSSAKGDDVDVVWVLKRDEGNGLTLSHNGISRLRWVPRDVSLVYIEGTPDRYGRAAESWPAGTAECVTLLDKLHVPLDASRREAAKTLKAAGDGKRNHVLSAALRWRRGLGDHSGTTWLSTGRDQPRDHEAPKGADQGGDHYGDHRGPLSESVGTGVGGTVGTTPVPGPPPGPKTPDDWLREEPF